jgi:hypothetical protein
VKCQKRVRLLEEKIEKVGGRATKRTCGDVKWAGGEVNELKEKEIQVSS